MTWGKVDDGLHSHPKWTQLSVDAKALWTTALSYCNAYLTNGEITSSAAGQLAIETFGANPEAFERFDRAAAELVAVRAPQCKAGLWKRRGTSFAFHEWHLHQPDAEDEKLRKARNARSRELHNTAKGRKLKALVIERDAGRCRYCGRLTLTEMGPGADTRAFDHVDPNGRNTPANVVIACGRCNRKKNARTPDDAGMPLLPPHNTDIYATRGDSANPPRETVDLAGVREGRDGSGRAGPGRVGPGRAGDGDGDGDGAGLRLVR